MSRRLDLDMRGLPLPIPHALWRHPLPGRGRLSLCIITLVVLFLARFEGRHHHNSHQHRVARIGDRLMLGLPAQLRAGVQFHVVADEPVLRSYSRDAREIMVTRSLVDALDQDAWLATVLAYELGIVVQQRTGKDAASVDSLAANLLSTAGYHPSVIPGMGEWILGRTSLAREQVTPDDVLRFASATQAMVERQFPRR